MSVERQFVIKSAFFGIFPVGIGQIIEICRAGKARNRYDFERINSGQHTAFVVPYGKFIGAGIFYIAVNGDRRAADEQGDAPQTVNFHRQS